MNHKKLFTSVSISTIATLSLSLPTFACTDPSDNFSTPKQLGDISTAASSVASTYRVKMENGCVVNAGSDLIKISDSLGSSAMTGGASSNLTDKKDIFKFTWKSANRNVTLNTNGAQISIYKDLGGGQKQLLVSSPKFLSNLPFSVTQNSSYFLEFYNSTLDGTNTLYTGTLN
jgi:hypothetical protein